MPISDIADIVITSQNPGVTAQGFGTDLILGPNAGWVELTREYQSSNDVLADFAANTPEYMAANSYFSQSPAPERLVIGRGSKPTQRYSFGVPQSPVVSGLYSMRVACKSGSAWLSRDLSYTAAAAAAWLATHAYAQGDLVVNDSGPLKFYICTVAGTSAGSGGPTGTGAAITDNTVTWMYAGTGVLGTASNDAIVYNLMIQGAALATPAIPGTFSLTGSAAAKSLRLLATTAGDFIGAQVYNRGALSSAQDHADPGVATDLAALKSDNPNWYGLTTLFNSSAYILAAAAWVESNTKLYIAASLDSEIATVSESIATDVGHAVKAASYARTQVFHHPSNDQFADAAEVGKFFPFDPGSENWLYKTLNGVTVEKYSATETTNMEAKYVAYYYELARGANVIGGEGKVGANEYVDVVRGRDWYVARLGERLVNLAIKLKKIPFTDGGIALVESEVRGQNQEGIDQGLIAASPKPIVTVPLAASVSSADKAARLLRNVNTNWTLAGAINKIRVNVVASV